MKRYNILNLFVSVLVVGVFSWSCEENQELPDLQTVGTSTATIAEISVSYDEDDEELNPGDQVVITLYYINLAEDPASQLKVLEKVGSNDFTELSTMDESSAAVASEITRTINYTIPNVDSATVITLDMLLSSKKEFPQRERTSLTVQ